MWLLSERAMEGCMGGMGCHEVWGCHSWGDHMCFRQREFTTKHEICARARSKIPNARLEKSKKSKSENWNSPPSRSGSQNKVEVKERLG